MKCLVLFFLLISSGANAYQVQTLKVGEEPKWRFPYLITCEDGFQFSSTHDCSGVSKANCVSMCSKHGGFVVKANNPQRVFQKSNIIYVNTNTLPNITNITPNQRINQPAELLKVERRK
jgi:hypothetical protein